MKAVPTSFDFDSQALRPDYVVKCSYGNDSIALLQFLHEHGALGKVVVLYNDTGWATSWWGARVANAEEKLVKPFGYIPARTQSKGMEQLVMEKGGWPDEFRKFCTEELKIEPTQAWLRIHDPEGKSKMVCGVRREESPRRALWPEYIENGIDEGRSQWSPLVKFTLAERDGLIRRAGWVPLLHRSRECRCINANSSDLKTWSEKDITDVDSIEQALQLKYPGKIKFMFHPAAKAGSPQGIRQVVEWAKKVTPRKRKGQPDHYEEPSGGCDSGYCTS